MATIYTIGHGNRAIEEFIALLKEAGIECLVDVRAYPASRRHPQFGREALERSLADAGVLSHRSRKNPNSRTEQVGKK